MSTITAFTPIPERSDATPGLFNARFQQLQDNILSVNTDLAGWNKGSISTVLDTSAGTLSVLTIRPASGNTIPFTGAVSTNTIGAQSGNTVRVPNGQSLIARSVDSGGQHIDVSAFGIAPVPGQDNTALLQALFNSNQTGNTVYYFPPIRGVGRYEFYLPAGSAITIPPFNGIVLRGGGLRASALSCSRTTIDFFASFTSWNGLRMNGLVIEDLQIIGGRNCIALNAVGYFRISRNYIQSAASSGISLVDCLIGTIDGNEIDACQDGISSVLGVGSGTNGVGIINNTIEGNTRYGCYFQDGFNGGRIVGNVIENNKRGGIVLKQGCIGVDISANYFEENHNSVDSCADIWLGEDASGAGSYVKAIEIHSNYFNGRSQGTTTDYAPIRAAFADGVHVHDNSLAVGTRWVKFDAATILNSKIERTTWHSTVSTTSSYVTTLFHSVPSNWANQGNVIDEGTPVDVPVVPLIPETYIRSGGTLMWQRALAGSSTCTAVSTRYRGRAEVIQLARNAGAAEIFSEVSVNNSLGDNAEVAGRFITWGQPIRAQSGSTDASLILTLSTDGVGGSGATVGVSNLQFAAGWRTFYVTNYCPASCTTITLDIAMSGSSGTVLLERPRLFVGAACITASS